MATILEERPEQLIIYDGGKVFSVANSDYWRVKWEIFNGKQITIQLPENSQIAETFDARIFNVVCRGQRIQVREEHADVIAKAAAKYIKDKDSKPFFKVCEVIWLQDHKHELVDKILANISGVVKDPLGDGYIVNDFFKVDNKGISWFMDKDKSWHHLCTVLKGHVEKRKMPTVIGPVELDVTSQTIIAKVYFLLFPNLGDGVFTNQLPKYILDELQSDTRRKNVFDNEPNNPTTEE